MTLRIHNPPFTCGKFTFRLLYGHLPVGGSCPDILIHIRFIFVKESCGMRLQILRLTSIEITLLFIMLE